MKNKMKSKGEVMVLVFLLIVFFKYVIGFFAEDGDKSPIALILFNQLIVLALIMAIMFKQKIIKINEGLLKQTKLDKYFKINND